MKATAVRWMSPSPWPRWRERRFPGRGHRPEGRHLRHGEFVLDVAKRTIELEFNGRLMWFGLAGVAPAVGSLNEIRPQSFQVVSCRLMVGGHSLRLGAIPSSNEPSGPTPSRATLRKFHPSDRAIRTGQPQRPKMVGLARVTPSANTAAIRERQWRRLRSAHGSTSVDYKIAL